MARWKLDLRTVAWAAYWVCLVIVFLALRAKQLEAILDDESIAVKISQAMRARRSLDPNWRFADLPHYFRYDQYNFYLYNVLAHAVITGGGWLHLAPLFALRWANVPFQLAALAFTADAARRIGAGRFTVALVGALIALAPGMVQDASLARPESFLYLLSALFLWVLTLPLAERWRMLLAGAVLGTGIAVKLTFGSLAIVLPFLVPIRGRGMRDLAATAVSFAAGAAIAIAALAPYALIHFDVYLNGIAALVAQYTGVHPPHALPVYDAVSQVAWIGGYFFQLYGFALPAALVAPFLLQGAARQWALALVTAFLALFIYFASKTVFFERNFAHVLIPLLLAAALGIAASTRKSWRIAATLLTVLPMAYWSLQIVRAIWTPKRRAQFESAHALGAAQPVHFPQIHSGDVPAQCDTIALHDLNDPWTRSYREKLRQRGFHEIAHYHSGLGPLVTSTLHTYFARDVRYFRCPPASAPQPPKAAP
jgi:hypothetical protein